MEILFKSRLPVLMRAQVELRSHKLYECMSESLFKGGVNRLLQLCARFAPGAKSFRVWCHRQRGVKIGTDVWIGYDVLLDTGFPELISIGDHSTINIRATLIGHFLEATGIRIEEKVFVGPCAVIMPGVTLGAGCVVTAGSVVTSSVAAKTVVQGNPARPIALAGLPLHLGVPWRDFLANLSPLPRGIARRK